MAVQQISGNLARCTQPGRWPGRHCSIDDKGAAMRHVRRGPVTLLAATGCVVALAAAAAVPASASAAAAAKTSICSSAKHPKLAARISRGVAAALASRSGSYVGLASSDAADDLTCKLHEYVYFYAASVIKVTIISALLLKENGPKHLTKAQHDLAYLMITQSSNSAAQKLWEEVGVSHVQHFLDEADMRHTILNDAWGLTLITAHDELTLLHLLTTKGKVLSNSSRGYVLWLMSKVISSQRWGVSAGAPADVSVHIKNGWLPYPKAKDWRINSIGAFTGKDIAYQIVILTGPPGDQGQGESYGIQTIEAAAAVINKDLA
jgi:Beta-lactamase enzyme family